MAPSRHADEHQECPLIEVHRKGPAHGQSDANDPNVWSGRALQEVFVDLVVSGLASMYPVSSWSCLAPDHHGYQRACVLISGQASIGPFGSPVFACAGKTDPLSLISLADLGWKGLIGLRHRLLLISPSSFVRAKGRSFVPARRTSIASRAGAVKAGRRGWLAAGSGVARLRLDRPEHGARIKRVGRLHRQSSSARSRVLWPAPPRRCGRACWRARSPARWGATASWRLRSRI